MFALSKRQLQEDLPFDYRLRYLMFICGLSMFELAKLTDLTPACISRLSAGQCLPNYESLKKICFATECNADFLLGISNVLKFRVTKDD